MSLSEYSLLHLTHTKLQKSQIFKLALKTEHQVLPMKLKIARLFSSLSKQKTNGSYDLSNARISAKIFLMLPNIVVYCLQNISNLNKDSCSLTEYFYYVPSLDIVIHIFECLSSKIY